MSGRVPRDSPQALMPVRFLYNLSYYSFMGSLPYKIKDTTLKGFIVAFALFFLIMGIEFLVGYVLMFVPPLFIIYIPIAIFFFMYIPMKVGINTIEIKAIPRQRLKGKDETIKALKSMASTKYPFEFKETGKYDLLLRLKLADAKWKGVLFRGGLDKAYWLYLKFDEKNKTVYCAEKTKSIKWDKSAGLKNLKADFRFDFFYGVILMDKEKIKIYDPLQGFKKVADIRYDLSEAKWPVFHMLIKNGWKIKPKMFPFQVKK